MVTLASYNAIPQGDKHRTLAAFKSIIDGAGTQDRVALVHAILDDVASGKGRVTFKETAQALLAAKTLARLPDGTRAMAETKNLLTLLKVISTPTMSQEAQAEALRCAANALLIVEGARREWIDIGGGDACVELFEKDNSTAELLFPAARCLYLVTITPSPYIPILIEKEHLVDALARRLDGMTLALGFEQPWSREAATDTLKVVFNLLIQYPRMLDDGSDANKKVLGELWDEQFEPLVGPLVRLLHNAPSTPTAPLTAPLTHAIHALLNVPVAAFPTIFFPTLANVASGARHTPTYSSERERLKDVEKDHSRTHPHVLTSAQVQNGPVNCPPTHVPESFSQRALSYLQRRSFSGPSPSPLSSSHASSSTATSTGRRLSPHPSGSPPLPPPDALRRALALLDSATLHYFAIPPSTPVPSSHPAPPPPPTVLDPDDLRVRQRAREEGVNLDELLPPLVLLISRFVLGQDEARARARAALLPPDLDRSTPLQQRPDLLGRLCRLLLCVHFPQLKNSVGELLFTICDSDATIMSTQIGYGVCAGYLFNKGIMVPPPPPSSNSTTTSTRSSSPSSSINPITGTTNGSNGTDSDSEMTEEEKEREAERLFVLFDRLERTGVGVVNPVRKAAAEGRFAEIE